MKKVVMAYVVAISFSAAIGMNPGDNQANTLIPSVTFSSREVAHQQMDNEVSTAIEKAISVWGNFKDTVLSDDSVFDEFLAEVFIGKYKSDACATKPLLEYKMKLARFYIDAASNMLQGVGNQAKSSFAQKAFLVYIAARKTDPVSFEQSQEGKSLSEECNKMFERSYDPDLETNATVAQIKKKLEKQNSNISYKLVAQMSQAYEYAKRHCALLVTYIWRFFYENKVVNRRLPRK